MDGVSVVLAICYLFISSPLPYLLISAYEAKLLANETIDHLSPSCNLTHNIENRLFFVCLFVYLFVVVVVVVYPREGV